MLDGDAPRAENIDVQRVLTGTRIFKPARSSGLTIGLDRVVICRNPLFQIRSMTNRPAPLICLRNSAPSSPSIARQTVGSSGQAKPIPYIEPAGITVESPATPETEKNSSAPLRT